MFQLCVPLALFFVTGDKKFVPIAIQLYQHIAPNNPVTHCTLNAGSRCMSDVKILSPKVLCVRGTEHSLDVCSDHMKMIYRDEITDVYLYIYFWIPCC